MERRRDRTGRYECVDPALGARLWEYELPGVDPDLNARLDRHLSVCDACRLSRAVERSVASGFNEGWLEVAEPAGHTFLSSLLGWAWNRATAAGSLAVALSILLVFLLPPRAPELDVVPRAGSVGAGFTHPVEGEVLLGRRPGFAWVQVEGATGYRITVEEIGGSYVWSGRTDRCTIRTPAEAALPPAGDFRAYLECIPSDLARLGDINVSFHSATPGRFLTYRLGHADRWAYGVGLIGLALLFGAALRRIRHRGDPAR